MFDDFHGNAATTAALRHMLESGRIAQTILLAGPEGIGKATLVRRIAAHLLGSPGKIEQDDLSLDANRAILAEREKWPSDKRADDPLFFSAHPDFVTFCPDGPLRQLSIQQMRLAKERSHLRPLRGQWRVFLIDQIDRAPQQSADSLLKTLEEPPEHLLLFLTAANAYDLPSTIRSRAVIFNLSPLPDAEMRAFAATRRLDDLERRLAIAAGCPGIAASIDLAAFDKRRAILLTLLESAAGVEPFGTWMKASESFLASKTEKLDLYFGILYSLLADLLTLVSGLAPTRNRDLGARLSRLSSHVSFDWIHDAIRHTDELVSLQRRNVQKGPSLDQLVVRLRCLAR